MSHKKNGAEPARTGRPHEDRHHGYRTTRDVALLRLVAAVQGQRGAVALLDSGRLPLGTLREELAALGDYAALAPDLRHEAPALAHELCRRARRLDGLATDAPDNIPPADVPRPGKVRT